MGKTLMFWMPLLFRPKGSIQIIVTPLNILGKQNIDQLQNAGFRGANTATAENFRESPYPFCVVFSSRIKKCHPELDASAYVTDGGDGQSKS